MKIGGQEIRGPMEEVIVLPRADDQVIVLKARAVLDLKEFRRLCPEPVPKKMLKRGGEEVLNTSDPAYKAATQAWGELYIHYLTITSLQATDGGIEFDTVELTNPGTWKNWEQDFKNAGFSEMEINRVRAGVMTANALNEQKIKEARENFLHSQVASQNGQSSPNTELKPTPSGELANASD
jgi:hypothetical protein